MKFDYAKIGKALVAMSRHTEEIHLITAGNGWIVQEEVNGSNRPTIGTTLEIALCQHVTDCDYGMEHETDETI